MSVPVAAWRLAQGAVIAYPTESCFGLGCDPLDQEAVLRLLDIKCRAQAEGLILIGGEWGHLEPYIGELPGPAFKRLQAAWPGPATFLVPPAPGRELPWIQGDHATLALRWTAHPEAAQLCQAFGGAVVSTSANRHGESPARSVIECQRRFGVQLDYYLAGPLGGDRQPSAIIDAVTGKRFR